jgi:hypothetical protein
VGLLTLEREAQLQSQDEYEAIFKLIADGMNDCAILRCTGIPRRTIQTWRRRPPVRRRQDCPVQPHDEASLPARPYSYLLGLYLGDGCISRNRRVWALRITLDKSYPGIIDAAVRAINEVLGRKGAGAYPRKTGCTDVVSYSKHWPCLFPQYGAGRKHERLIRLESWQRALVAKATEDFVRGLIDSDGCRVVANDRGVASLRYHFTNHSEDILGLFTGALDAPGIPWTRNSWHTIGIYRKAATARLDEFVGPKSAPRPDLTEQPVIPPKCG